MNTALENWKNYYIRYHMEKIKLIKKATTFGELATNMYADSSVTHNMLKSVSPLIEPEEEENFLEACRLISDAANERVPI